MPGCSRVAARLIGACSEPVRPDRCQPSGPNASFLVCVSALENSAKWAWLGQQAVQRGHDAVQGEPARRLSEAAKRLSTQGYDVFAQIAKA